METIKLAAGLLLLVFANILLGATNAVFTDAFNAAKLKKGFAKAGIIVICFMATYFVGLLNPQIAAIQINGVEVDVLAAVRLVILAGYYHYTRQVIEKLTTIVSGESGSEHDQK